jgi:hypothetical protein
VPQVVEQIANDVVNEAPCNASSVDEKIEDKSEVRNIKEKNKIYKNFIFPFL